MSPITTLIPILLLVTQTFSIIDRTYYIYLGLDITATPSQITSAYQSKKQKIQALEQEEARTTKLKLLEQAYQVLGNGDKRALYDRLNKDLFRKEAVLGNFRKITEKNVRKSRAMMITLPVSVEDVYHGKTVQATFLKQTACAKCKGTGAESPKFLNTCPRCGGNGFTLFEGVNQFGQRFVNENTCTLCQGWGKHITKACPVCNGKKIVSKLEKVSIKIPHGLPDGNLLKIPNFGDEPITGAPSDLQVTIVEIPTQKWSRQGQNLIHTMDITFKQSIFGFQKHLTHLSNQQIQISRSQVTTRTTTVTIPEKGIKNPKTGRTGNLIIKFRIVMPKFTDQQLDMWEKFFGKYNL